MAVNIMSLSTVVNRKLFYQGQPATGGGALGSAIPSSTDAQIRSIVICNVTGSAATVTLYRVPSGGTAGVTNAILYGFNVQPNDTVTLESPINMTAGDFLSGSQGTSAAITVTVSGETYA